MNQTERAALGAALVDPPRALRCGLAPADFSDTVGGTIWQCITARASSGDAVDIITLLSDLGDQYRKLLGELASESFSAANLEAYADSVKTESKRRKLRGFLGGLDLSKDPDEVIGHALSALIEMGQGKASRSYSMQQLMALMTEEIERARELADSGESVGVPTGFADVDNLLGGYHRSDLIVVGGRPAMGKTAYLLSSAINAARRGYSCGIVSAEMSALQLGSRALSGASNVATHKMRNGRLHDFDYEYLDEAMESLSQLDVNVFDPDRCRPSDVLMQAHVWAAQKLDVLFVDYLQLLQPDSGHDSSRAREVGEMAKALKSVAKSLNIPVVALVQLSRQCETRPDKRPMMADLRDSGEIEEAADEILFLYRDVVYNDSADPNGAEIIIGKNRHGPVGHIDMAYIPDRVMWCDKRAMEWAA